MALELGSLAHFFDRCFYEDWDLDASSAEEAVARFVADAPREAEFAAADIGDLLAAELSEAEFAELVYGRLGCRYNAAADGLTLDEWMRMLRDWLAPGPG